MHRSRGSKIRELDCDKYNSFRYTGIELKVVLVGRRVAAEKARVYIGIQDPSFMQYP